MGDDVNRTNVCGFSFYSCCRHRSSSSSFLCSSLRSTRSIERQRASSSIRVRNQVSFQAFWKDQERHRIGGSIESRFVRSNDQRLLDQEAVDDVVTPHDAKVLPVHVVTVLFFVFGDRGGAVDVLRAFLRRRRVVALSIVVCVGHRNSQCCCPIANSRRTPQRGLLLLLCLLLGCCFSRRSCLLLDSDWFFSFDVAVVVVVVWLIERVLRCTMFTQTGDCLSFRHPHVSVSTFLACCCIHRV